jgi:hypothetical protein
MTHPITPPPELVQQWRNLPEYVSQLRIMSTVTITTEKLQNIATRAARWGADQELEACCEWFADDVVSEVVSVVAELRAARRPKPPSLKEQALEGLTRLVSTGEFFSNQMKDLDTIRRALEALDD